MKNVLRTLCVLLLMLFTITCDDDDSIQYRLTTEASPKEGGSVSPNSSNFNEGTEVEIKATANDEYVFKNWTGDASGNENPMKVVMTDDMAVTAEFEKVEYTLDIIISGEGNVQQEILQSKSNTYPSGTHVKLTAVPLPGWQFAFWEGDAEGQENPLEITMTKSMTITVYFEPIEQTYVPDDNFEKALIDLGLDTWMNDYIYDLYVSDVTELDLSELNIHDLTGIEAFTSLERLDCSNNQLSSIDLSKNIELSSLDLSYNSLKEIDLTNNKNLGTINLSHNVLESLDISHFGEWLNLWVEINDITCVQVNEDQLNSDHTLNDCMPMQPIPWTNCMVVDEGVTFSLDCND